MSKVYYCPDCYSELEEISGCGALAYFCDKCRKLVSKKKILTEEELQNPQVNSAGSSEQNS